MKPLAHARLGAARHGGTWDDTIDIHTWLDSSKMVFASVQHRALLHHELGAELGQIAFGCKSIASRTYGTYELLCEHIEEDLGSVVSVTKWLDELGQVRHTQRLDGRSQDRGVLVLRQDPLENCAARYGGQPQDYETILKVLDSAEESSGGHPSARALHHNSFGPFLVESVIGTAITLSNGRLLATRTVAEDLILARMGWIAPASRILSTLPLKAWMTGGEQTKTTMAERKLREANTTKPSEI